MFKLSENFEALAEVLDNKPSFYREMLDYCANNEDYRIVFEYNSGTMEDIDDEGKCDIAYHFIIDPAGGIWQGAEIDEYQRGHAEGHFNDIGVVLLGDFESRWQNVWIPNTLNKNQFL